MSSDAEEASVTAMIEVAYFNLAGRRGLVVSGIRSGRSRRLDLPAGRLRPGEAPEAAAVRVLRDRAGISDVHHQPLLCGHRCDVDRHEIGPTLTLTYAILGPVPSNSHEAVQPAEATADQLRQLVAEPDTVMQARQALRLVLEETPIALRLLGRPDRPFTLGDLIRIYEEVIGDGVRIDRANFRRKVEAAKEFVVPVDPAAAVEPPAASVEPPDTRRRKRRKRIGAYATPYVPPPPTAPRGRPPRHYVAGTATTLDPPIRLRH